jgi:nicotinamide-nucleotide adenylyltransferase
MKKLKQIKQALFVGRFQPFHQGHLSVIKAALKKEDRLIIVIGSAEENHGPANPFTASERYQMIEETLRAEKISPEKYAIIPVRNVENFMLWTVHVDQYIPPVYKVYTGSQIVKELYENYGKYKIESVKMEDGKTGEKISGTKIREKLLKGDKSWEKLVHPKVVELIKKWKGEERIKMINV